MPAAVALGLMTPPAGFLIALTPMLTFAGKAPLAKATRTPLNTEQLRVAHSEFVRLMTLPVPTKLTNAPLMLTDEPPATFRADPLEIVSVLPLAILRKSPRTFRKLPPPTLV